MSFQKAIDGYTAQGRGPELLIQEMYRWTNFGQQKVSDV